MQLNILNMKTMKKLNRKFTSGKKKTTKPGLFVKSINRYRKAKLLNIVLQIIYWSTKIFILFIDYRIPN